LGPKFGGEPTPQLPVPVPLPLEPPSPVPLALLEPEELELLLELLFMLELLPWLLELLSFELDPVPLLELPPELLELPLPDVLLEHSGAERQAPGAGPPGYVQQTVPCAQSMVPSQRVRSPLVQLTAHVPSLVPLAPLCTQQWSDGAHSSGLEHDVPESFPWLPEWELALPELVPEAEPEPVVEPTVPPSSRKPAVQRGVAAVIDGHTWLTNTVQLFLQTAAGNATELDDSAVHPAVAPVAFGRGASGSPGGEHRPASGLAPGGSPVAMLRFWVGVLKVHCPFTTVAAASVARDPLAPKHWFTPKHCPGAPSKVASAPPPRSEGSKGESEPGETVSFWHVPSTHVSPFGQLGTYGVAEELPPSRAKPPSPAAGFLTNWPRQSASRGMRKTTTPVSGIVTTASASTWGAMLR
jgi:hypothetical protein